MAPWSRFAVSLKPNVAYLELNLSALWKKQTTLPSFAYAGIPYQVFGESAGALALTSAWSRLAMARSGGGISAIFARTSLSPSAFFARGLRRDSAFNSWARSFIAARSSSVKPLDVLPFVLGFLSAIAKYLHLDPPYFVRSTTCAKRSGRCSHVLQTCPKRAIGCGSCACWSPAARFATPAA